MTLMRNFSFFESFSEYFVYLCARKHDTLLYMIDTSVFQDKLAAYYTIMEHMQDNSMPAQKYSFAAGPPPSAVVDYQGTSEFAECARGMPLNDFMAVMDELMSTLQILNPKLYNSVIRRVSE